VYAFETGSWRKPTNIQIQYDKINSLMRVETASGYELGNSTYDGTFVMWLDFSSGIEWYYNVGTGKCTAFGLDYWNDWCYGEMENTQYSGALNIVGTLCDYWGSGDLYYSNAQYSCIPATKTRHSTGEFTLYYGYFPAVDPTKFIPNPACHLADVVGPAPAEHLEMIRAPTTKKRV